MNVYIGSAPNLVASFAASRMLPGRLADTTGLTLEEVVARIAELAVERRADTPV